MSAYVVDTGRATRRTVVFFLIVVVHGALIWAFASGFANKMAHEVAPDLMTDLLDEKKDQEKPPPPPPPQVERPPVQVVMPDIAISMPAEMPPPIQTTTTQPVAITPPAPRQIPGTGLITQSMPITEDYYPPQSQRLGEEGRPVIHVCADTKGRVTTVDLKTSSGFDRLDEAGVKVGHLMRFKAATQEGKPIEACKDIAVKFELKKGN